MESINHPIQELNSNQLNFAVNILRAISHPLRIKIIQLLSTKESLNVREIHDTLNLEQAVASHHLGILRDKGVLLAQRDGRKIFYSLKDKEISSIIAILSRIDNFEA